MLGKRVLNFWMLESQKTSRLLTLIVALEEVWVPWGLCNALTWCYVVTSMITLALPSVLCSQVKNPLLLADRPVVAEVKPASLLPSSLLTWFVYIPHPLTAMPYNSYNLCTLKVNCLFLAFEWRLQKSMMWMNGTIHSNQKRAREFTVQKWEWLTTECCIGYAKSGRLQRGNEWKGTVCWMGDSPHLHPAVRCLLIS